MSQPNCFENCQTWPVIESELERQYSLLARKLDQARTEEVLREQQHHESDGSYIPGSRVEEVEAEIEWEGSIIETERNDLRTKAERCSGAPCVLAEYCVRTTVTKDLKNLI